MTKKAKTLLKKIAGLKPRRIPTDPILHKPWAIGPGKASLNSILWKVEASAKNRQRSAAKYLLNAKNFQKRYKGIEDIIDTPGIIQQAIKDIIKARPQ